MGSRKFKSSFFMHIPQRVFYKHQLNLRTVSAVNAGNIVDCVILPLFSDIQGDNDRVVLLVSDFCQHKQSAILPLGAFGSRVFGRIKDFLPLISRLPLSKRTKR